jgi:hypothetical protein
MHISGLAVALTSLMACTAAIAQRGIRMAAERGPSCTNITSQEVNNTGLTKVADTVGVLPTVPGAAANKPACVRPSTTPAPPAAVPQQAQATPAASPAKTGSDVRPEPPTSPPNDLDDRLSKAEEKLDADLKACRPIDFREYNELFVEAGRNFDNVTKAANARAPVDNELREKIRVQLNRASRLGLRALDAKKSCKSPDKTAMPVETSPLATTILAVHNAERAEVGVPPLQWNLQLEMEATAYAKQLASTGRLVHAPREGRGIERESLQKGLIGRGGDQLLHNWVNEKRDFHPGLFPNVCTGDWPQCAHYTQMIWPTTTDLGCGIAPGGGFLWLVCRYSPGGNKDGKCVGLARNKFDTSLKDDPAMVNYRHEKAQVVDSHGGVHMAMEGSVP